MREPTHLSRRAIAAALPIATLVGTTRPAAASDAALLDLGRQWAVAWDALVANDRAFEASEALSDVEMRDLEAEGERLYAAEQLLFDAILATPARTLAGLAVKARVLARTHDVQDRGVEAVEAAAEGAELLTTRATFSVALDVLKLASAAS